MTIKPILMSGPMVRAVLDGRKTQTRRVLNPQPERDCHHFDKVFAGPPYFEARNGNSEPICPFHYPKDCVSPYPRISIGVGDLLYVREAWRVGYTRNECKPSRWPTSCAISYIATDDDEDVMFGKFRQGMHMPRWASRITLKVTDVRVQRVQDITHAEGYKQGVNSDCEAYPGLGGEFCPRCNLHRLPSGVDGGSWVHDGRDLFAQLWNSLNEKRGYGWEANPWVAAYTFEPIFKNVDEYNNYEPTESEQGLIPIPEGYAEQ